MASGRWLGARLSEHVAAGRAGFGGALDGVEMSADHPMVHRTSVDNTAEPTEEREPTPDEASPVGEEGAAVSALVQRKLLLGVVERTGKVPEFDLLRWKECDFLSRCVGERSGLRLEFDYFGVAIFGHEPGRLTIGSGDFAATKRGHHLKYQIAGGINGDGLGLEADYPSQTCVNLLAGQRAVAHRTDDPSARLPHACDSSSSKPGTCPLDLVADLLPYLLPDP